MGELLRRYWTPACLTAEIPEPGGAPARVRLLGENLVAFRDTTGRIGLVQENCPHRGASLYFGRNEDAALRCVYHGWAFDAERPLRGHAERAGAVLREGPDAGLPHPRVRRHRLDLHGPAGDHDPVPRLRHRGAGRGRGHARSSTRTCNWVQAMEGNIDTAHISHLHQWDGIDDIPDDGSDKPGYPSNAMSWKFWRHDRAPRLEVDDTWYGYRYAGIRTTPNGNTHVRITAYALPYHTMVASIPFSVGQGMFIPIDDNNCWRYFIGAQGLAEPAQPRRREPVLHRPVLDAGHQTATNGITPRLYTAENDYQIDRGRPAHRHLQRRRRLRQPGPDGDRVDGPDLRPHPGAARLHRQGHQPDAAPPHLRRQGPGRRARSPRRRRRAGLHGPSAARRRSSNPARTGASLGTDDDPVVRESLGATTGEQLTDMVD